MSMMVIFSCTQTNNTKVAVAQTDVCVRNNTWSQLVCQLMTAADSYHCRRWGLCYTVSNCGACNKLDYTSSATSTSHCDFSSRMTSYWCAWWMDFWHFVLMFPMDIIYLAVEWTLTVSLRYGLRLRIYILIVRFLGVCPLFTKRGRGTFSSISMSFFFT